MDTVKLAISATTVAAAVVGFYYYADHSLLVRVVALLVAFGVSIAIGLQTEKGRLLAAFVRDAQIETRKVVWPTRQESLQTTLIVFVVVVLTGFFLWLLDMGLNWAIRFVTAGG